ncbi:hypothetical protein P2318_00980 [Myxococcaceae bacterium GXIMD 01537]
MAKKKQAPSAGQDTAAQGEGARRGRTGRLTVRRETAPYRAAGQEQATRVREAIEAAMVEARRTREEIEARIERQWHNREAPVRKPAAPARRVKKGRAKA